MPHRLKLEGDWQEALGQVPLKPRPVEGCWQPPDENKQSDER
jgi:hypothetical protein